MFPVLRLLERLVQHDAVRFIEQTGFQPLIVAAIGVGLAVLAFRVFRWKTQFGAKLKAFFEQAAGDA